MPLEVRTKSDEKAHESTIIIIIFFFFQLYNTRDFSRTTHVIKEATICQNRKNEAVLKLAATFDRYNSLENGSKNMIHSHQEIGIKEINFLLLFL